MEKQILSDSHLCKVLKKMCKPVKANYDKIDWCNGAKPYYREYQWTKKQQDNFIEWLSDYLYVTSAARKEFMMFPIKNKTFCRQIAIQFISWFGWETKVFLN